MTKKKQKSNSNSRSKITGIVIAVLFILLVLVNLLVSYYSNQVKEFNEAIFPSNQKGGFTLFNAYKLADEELFDSLPSGAHIWLNPGGAYVGKLGIKNHDIFEHTFALNIDEAEYIKDAEGNKIEDLEEKIEVDQDTLPVLDLYQNIYRSLPNQIQFIDYTVTVPENTLPGTYEFLSRLRVEDETRQLMRTADGLIVSFSVGVPIFVNVVEGELPEHEYTDYSEFAEGFVVNNFVMYFRLFLALALALATVYLIYLAYKSEE